jgi:hypothetical protein
MILMSVVLPPPEGPVTVTNSPDSISKLKSSSTKNYKASERSSKLPKTELTYYSGTAQTPRRHRRR